MAASIALERDGKALVRKYEEREAAVATYRRGLFMVLKRHEPHVVCHL